MSASYQLIPLDHLRPGRYQPRVDFDLAALQELAESIATQGLIEPLIVRGIAGEHYEIIAGERRWRAAQLAGLTEVPCLVGDYTDQQAATVTLVENIQRESLNVIEEAGAYKRLLDEFALTQEDIAALVGKSRSHIANLLRLLTLCESVQEKVRAGLLSLGHARVLVGLSPAQQQSFAHDVEIKQWSVRHLEDKVRNMKLAPKSVRSFVVDRDIDHLQMVLSEQVGAPVSIVSDNESGGSLQFKFFDNETLAVLLERMGLRYDD